MKKILVLFSFMLSATIFAANISDNKVNIGKGSADKELIFDTGDGTSNKKIKLNGTTKKLSVNVNELTVGTGAATDQALTFDVGGATKPAIKYNTTTGKVQVSHDGASYSDIGSGGGSGVVYSVNSTAAFTAAVNNGYFLTGTTLQAITLPSSGAVGDKIVLNGMSIYNFKLKSNSGAATQKIVQSAYESNASSSSAIDIFQTTAPYASVTLAYAGSGTWQVEGATNGSTIGDFNYWGSAADGSLSTVGNTNISSTALNGSLVQDGDCAVSQYQDLTVNSGHTLTLSARARCWVIYVKGNLHIAATGKISMTDRAGKANPNDAGVTANTPVAPTDAHAVTSNGFLFRRKVPGGTATNSGTDLVFGGGTPIVTAESFQRVLDATNPGKVYGWAKVGAGGGASASSGGTANGNAGSNGTTSTNITTAGGGGSGGCYQCAGSPSGAGGSASTWSGGMGGGSAHVASGSCVATAGSSFGGAGGNACSAGSIGSADSGAGAGNPQGTGIGQNNGQSTNNDGAGGSLAIFVRGNITGGGTIESKGHKGQESVVSGNGGGSSGGGQILWLYAGTDSSTITTSVSGGVAATGPASNGGAGGNGVVQKEQISL